MPSARGGGGDISGCRLPGSTRPGRTGPGPSGRW
jgi:hypothetical protein